MFFKYLSLSRLHWRLRRHLPLPPVISHTISFSALDDEWSPAKKDRFPCSGEAVFHMIRSDDACQALRSTSSMNFSFLRILFTQLSTILSVSSSSVGRKVIVKAMLFLSAAICAPS